MFRRLATTALVVLVALSFTTPLLAVVAEQPTASWGTNGRIDVILPIGDRIVVGGTFTAIVDPSGATYPASNLAVFSASTGAADLGFQATTDGQVNALAVAGNQLFIGGKFATVDGGSRSDLAAVDPATGALLPWKVSSNGVVDALAVAGTSLFASGSFTKITTPSGGAQSRSYVAKLDTATGALDTTWSPAPDSRVRALAVSADASTLYLGGDFTTLGVTSTNKAAAVSVATGAVITTFKSVPNNMKNYATVYALATDGTSLYEAVGGSGGACTAVSASTGALVWSKKTNGNVHGVERIGATVYCGGHFSGTGSFDGQDRSKLAAVDATTYTTLPFAPVVNSALGVWTTATDGTHLFAGGDFTKISGVPDQHYAEFVDPGTQTAPLAPQNLTATAGDGYIDLSWSVPSSDGGSAILRYKVYRSSGGGQASPIATVSSGTSYRDTALVVGTTYTYTVTAVNAIGESPASNAATATAVSSAVTAPGAPTGLAATDNAGTVHLAWTAPTDTGNSSITGYNVYRGTSSGQEQLLTQAGTTTSYDDATVTSKTTYYYYVTAVNSVGEGPASNEASVTPGATVPGAPTLTGTAGAGVDQLSWTPPTDDGGSAITKYVISRSDVGRLATVSATTTTYNDTNVSAGTTYTYQVRAVNGIGAGPYSNKVVLTPTS